MPTLQTTPYIAWTFPDQAYHMNKYGIGRMASVPIPTQDVEGGADATKAHFDDHARAVAIARLQTNKNKELGMLGLRNTTERSQRHNRPASQSSRPNGKFMPPSYEYTQTPSGLRGGTGAITKEGRAYVIRRLKERIAELDAIESSNYDSGPPPRMEFLPQFNELDTTLQSLLDSLATAAISNSMLEVASKVQTAMVRAGLQLTEQDVSKYVQIVQNMKRGCLSLLSDKSAALAAEKKRIIKALQRSLERMDTILEAIMKTIGLPEDVRSKSLATLQSQVFSESASKFEVARPGADAAAEATATKKANAEMKRQLKARITAEVAGFDAGTRANIRQRVQSGEISVEDLADELDVLPETITRIVGE
jgi:hypothetical protein